MRPTVAPAPTMNYQTQVQLLSGGRLAVADLTQLGLTVVEGSVTHDGSRLIHGSYELTLVGDASLPVDGELRILIGYGTNLQAVITGPYEAPKTVDSHNQKIISLVGGDRDLLLQNAGFNIPTRFEGDTLEVITEIHRSRLHVDVDFKSLSASRGSIPEKHYTPGDNPAEAVAELVESMGLRRKWDGYGRRRIFEPPRPTDLAAVHIDGRSHTAPETVPVGEAFDGVIVEGTAPWLLFDVRGEAWLPNSTRSHPKIVRSDVVGSDLQATKQAQTLLNDITGQQHTLTWSQVPDTRLEIDDIARIGSERLNRVIERTQLSLTPSTMNVRTRAA